jgi:putative spermidine/putrescine transport system ATP-binding protein
VSAPERGMLVVDIVKRHARGPEIHAAFRLAAEAGRVLVLFGPSGAGKTTVLRCLAGLDRPSSGQIVFGGRTWFDGTAAVEVPPQQRGVGYLAQEYALFPHRDVRGNVGYGLSGLAAGERRGRVDAMIDAFGLEDLQERRPAELSVGQQQRVALARALAIEPTCLLLDEPLSALDAKIRVALRVEIREIQRKLGITTVYVTHDQEEALELSDRIVVMSEGRVEQIGTPFEIYNFPATDFVASFVGTLNTVPAKIVDPGRRRLALAGTEVGTSSEIQGTAGDRVTVAIRPEMISLDGAAEGGPANRVQATVQDVAFLGAVVRVRTTLSDGSSVSVDTFNNPNLAVPASGASVALRFPNEAVLVLGREAVRDGSDVLAAAEALL